MYSEILEKKDLGVLATVIISPLESFDVLDQIEYIPLHLLVLHTVVPGLLLSNKRFVGKQFITRLLILK